MVCMFVYSEVCFVEFSKVNLRIYRRALLGVNAFLFAIGVETEEEVSNAATGMHACSEEDIWTSS